MNLTKLEENGLIIYEIAGNLLGEVDGQVIFESFTTDFEKGNLKFIFDLSNLKYINSTGLGNLLKIVTKAKETNAQICFTNLSESFNKLILMTRLNQFFTIAPNIVEAKGMLAG
ncbi:MAG: STAS domain-containing protein [Chitinophagales bacterium]|nr:STAS domain-containing protein [Chitinophagales bacterium]